jgi:hypothetical protein
LQFENIQKNNILYYKMNRTRKHSRKTDEDEGVPYNKNRPCPPGYYRKRNGNCALAQSDEQLSPNYVEPSPKPKRCPPGYYRKRNGDCAPAESDEQLSPNYVEPSPKPKSKRCRKGTRKNKSGDCVPFSKPAKKSDSSPSQRTDSVIAVDDITTITNDLLAHQTNIKIQNPSIQYLLALINKHTPSQLRAKNERHNLMLPFERYSTDKPLLLYILREIIELSINRTRDSKKKLVSVKIIQDVVERDDQFRELLA